ncbi:hypothetical protein [Amycolatopsis sp. NPDC059657]|uniref:hypothetical protein n=1 Tax=Amycolatopsis sp. NPDC059657 TaxID=3346899 RepID=UPI00366EDB5E
MRIRIAVALGGFLLAGGLITGGAAFADQPSTSTTKPAPTAAPGEPTRTTTKPAPAEPTRATRPEVVPAPGKPRVPKAVPAGPTGDLHLPAITAA